MLRIRMTAEDIDNQDYQGNNKLFRFTRTMAVKTAYVTECVRAVFHFYLSAQHPFIFKVQIR